MSLKSHKIVLINLIRMLPKKKNFRMAEIGLGRTGAFRKILKLIPESIFEYWGIDPFFPSFAIGEEEKYEKTRTHFYLKACKSMLQYPQLRIIRAPSPEIAKIFPDEFFDLVFIDANHSYDAVKADILAWLPHVKLRRFLTGHDYFHGESGVVKAVDEFFDTNVIVIKRVWIHQRKNE